VNEHNGWVPRDFWLEDWEKQAIIGFHLKNPLEGYRRLTFMMLSQCLTPQHRLHKVRDRKETINSPELAVFDMFFQLIECRTLCAV